ncbi:MAG: phycobilisome linker polypeptide, partial [Cyanobacteriota bacterium]|nr:phycobilisome linker polypeptide [Cyanobacteriota bacterium]
YDSWFAEQQRIQKQGGRIIKVELCTGGQQVNVGN